MAQVSVIIPTYNAATTIIAAVDSALNQEGLDVEVFVIDDGSEDGTCDLLSQFGSRLTLIRRRHQGRSVTRNVGLLAANAPYIAFLDADDTWSQNKLEAQRNLLIRFPTAVLTYSRARWMDERGVVIQPAIEIGGGQPGLNDLSEELLCGNIIPLLTVVAKTDALKYAGGFEPSLDVVEDWDLWLRLAKLGQFYFFDDCLAQYRTDGFLSMCRRESAEAYVDQCISMISRHCAEGQKEKARLSIYVRAVIQSTLVGDLPLATKYIKLALSTDAETTCQMLSAEIEDLTMFLSMTELGLVRQEVARLLVSCRGPLHNGPGVPRKFVCSA